MHKKGGVLCALNIYKKISSQKMLIIILLISAVILAMAYIMKHFFNIHPCQMCLYERNVFIGTAGIAFVSLISLPEHSKYYAIVALGFIVMGGAFLAGYHVAIQQHWVALPAFAHLLTESLDSVQALKEHLLRTPFVRCDQVTWSFLGLSLATYNDSYLPIYEPLMLEMGSKHQYK